MLFRTRAPFHACAWLARASRPFQFPGQLLFSARLAVDTFLWLAGFLLTLGALKKLRPLGLAPASTSSTASVAASSSGGDAFSGVGATAAAAPPPPPPPLQAAATPTTRGAFALLFALNRVLRLLPLYAACVLFWWHVAPRWGSGPFWFAWEGATHE